MKWSRKKQPTNTIPQTLTDEKTELKRYVETFKKELVELKAAKYQKNMPLNLYAMTKEEIRSDFTRSVERKLGRHMFLDVYESLPSDVIRSVWLEISKKSANNEQFKELVDTFKNEDISPEDLATLYFQATDLEFTKGEPKWN